MLQSVAPLPEESEFLHGQTTYQFILNSPLKAFIMDRCHGSAH